MKRLISVILVLAMSMALCACQKDDTPQTISKTTKTDSIVVGDTVYFGFYEQDADSSNGTEAIEWEVLAIDGSNVLLISRYGLDGQDYHTSGKDVTYLSQSLYPHYTESGIQFFGYHSCVKKFIELFFGSFHTITCSLLYLSRNRS